jgi:hypothetical protein
MTSQVSIFRSKNYPPPSRNNYFPISGHVIF